MAYEKRTRPYEILVRLKPEGRIEQHVIDIEETYDVLTGVVSDAKELPARPITAEEAGQYLGEMNVRALESVVAREAASEERRAQLAAWAADLEDHRTKLVSAAASVMATAPGSP